MSIAIFLVLFVFAASVIVYPLLPGAGARQSVSPVASAIEDGDIERALEQVRQARKRVGLVCPTCGAEHRPGDLFCVRCGGELPETSASVDRQVCTACGAVLDDDDLFCPKCGHAVRSEVAT